MKIKKCKHDKIECKNSDNKFYCIKCKEKIEIKEWVKRYDLKKDLDLISKFKFDSKIKDAFY